MLPDLVCDRLRQHLEEVRACHQADLAHGLGRVVLPFALAEVSERRDRVALAVRVSCDSYLPRSAIRTTVAVSPARNGDSTGGRRGGAPGTVDQARELPHHAPFFCDSSPRGRIRHPHRPGAARARRRQYHDDLHARPQSRRVGREEPDRSDLAGVHCDLLAAIPGACQARSITSPPGATEYAAARTRGFGRWLLRARSHARFCSQRRRLAFHWAGVTSAGSITCALEGPSAVTAMTAGRFGPSTPTHVSRTTNETP